MAVIKWIETKGSLLRSEYLKLRFNGMDRHDIRQSFFGGDAVSFRDQLIEWELLSLDEEWEELRKMGKVAKAINMTKGEYLQRRLNGESRNKIARSLGIAVQRLNLLLKEWGIRELDAEERELELLAPAKPKKNVNERIAQNIEQKAAARSGENWPPEVVKELERTEAGEDILKRMQDRAEAQEKELASLQAAVALWKNDAERKSEHILTLEAEIDRCLQQLNDQSAEIDRLNEALAGAAAVANQAGAEISSLKSERELLLETIEQAAIMDSNKISFQIPIMQVALAVQERTRIYDALEALGQGVEGAEIDRQLVMSELFELLQRVVNFVTADLTELHPGQDATSFIHSFFNFYNEQHVKELVKVSKAG